MSYAQAMRWAKKHPKGTKRPVIMSTGSGFWPAHTWLVNEYWPYADECKRLGCKPLTAETFYHKTTRSQFKRQPSDYAAMTKAGTL